MTKFIEHHMSIPTRLVIKDFLRKVIKKYKQYKSISFVNVVHGKDIR